MLRRWSTLIAILSTGAALAAGSGLASRASTAHHASTQIVIGTSATNVEKSWAVAYVAAAEGYFSKRGLDVVIQPDGPGLAAAMLSNQVDLGLSPTGVAFGMAEQGAPITILYNVIGGGLSSAAFAADPSITSLSQCKKVMTFGPGTAPYAWTISLQKIFKTRWQIFTGASGAAIIAAVASHSVDCGVTSSGAQAAVAAGEGHYVFDPTKTQRPAGFPKAACEFVLFGTADKVKQIGSSTLVKLLQAFNQAAKAVRTMSPSHLAADILAYPGVHPDDEQVLTAYFQDTIRPFLAPKSGLISKGIWDESRRFWRAGGFGYLTATSKTFTYSKVVNMTYLQKALASK